MFPLFFLVLIAPLVASGSLAPRLSGSGTATHYDQYGAAGACGQIHSDSDMICALGLPLYDGGNACGDTLYVTNQETDYGVSVTVADLCQVCDDNIIDLSDAAFQALQVQHNLSVGVLSVTWHS